jgi:glycosyltransferase involved in cell wall biosynthesis
MKKILILKDRNKIGGLAIWIKYLKTGFSSKKFKIIITKPTFLTLFKLKNIDLVHIYEFSIFAFLLTALAKIKKIPVVATIHADLFINSASSSPAKRYVAKLIALYCLRRANRITTPTNYLKNILSKRNIAEKGKIEKIQNCVDLKYIGNIKSFSKEKNIQIVQITDFRYPQKARAVIDTIRAVVNTTTKVKIKLLIIGGRGSFLQFKKKYSSEDITFTGLVSHDTALKHLKSADILVHPTYFDNSPIAILEAFACAKPVICYNTGGIKEIAQGCAIICKPENLAKEIESLIGSKDKRRRIGKLSKTRSLKLTNQIISKKFERLYNCLINE